MANALEAIFAKGQRIGYVRVSTVEQNTARQLAGVPVDKVFLDRVSGKSLNRPQLIAALAYVREGDTLVVHSMDRLSRSLEDLRKIVRDLAAKGVSVEFVKERLTFAPHGNSITDKLLFTLMGVFAEFELELRAERQREGIAQAKADGKYAGRPFRLSRHQVHELYAMIDNRVTIAECARHFKVARQTIYDYLAKRPQPEKKLCPPASTTEPSTQHRESEMAP